jgi:hypothetical protein
MPAMRKNIIYYLAIALLVVSCGKEISTETNGTPPAGNGNGTQTGADTYQPSGKNSYWKYKLSGDFPGESTITSKGEQRTVNGIACTVYSGVGTGSQAGVAETLLGVKGNDYFSILKGASPTTGALVDITFLYLNDALPEGGSWKHTAGTGNGFTAFTPGKVLEKGITVVVEGKTYKDVIHTQIELQYELPVFGILTFATYDYYVAKNVGIIRILSQGDEVYGGGITSDMTLVQYSIK